MAQTALKTKTNPKSKPAKWSVDSWREFPIKQQPQYDDQQLVNTVEARLRTLPPLTTASEARDLKEELASCCAGNAFLLQGGDCAESFAEFNETNLQNFLRVMLQMTMALMYGAGSPVVKVGRIAGQFAKPRSSDSETIDGTTLPSYRGDMVNGMDFNAEARKPDPERIMQVYHQSAATLNYLRALSKGDFAGLHEINRWNMDFVASSPQGKRFQTLIQRIDECYDFLMACGLKPDTVKELSEATFYTSHEALLLGYESSLTRFCEVDEKWYVGSAHMLWIGDRTRGVDEAHVEFLRGVGNPIGCKVGPTISEDDLLTICDKLNPENEQGKLVLISRMGASKVADHLPGLVRAVKREGKEVIWSCDPMHGNIVKSPNGIKTRKFIDILSEVRRFFDIHKAEGTHGGGVHFEMTGQDVTECLGGAQAISELDLTDRYHTHCDPRLNASQSLELAFLIAEELKKSD